MSRLAHSCSNVELGTFKQFSSFGFVSTCKSDDDWHIGLYKFESLYKTFCNVVATGYTTEDINENNLHMLV